jgi:hypothetical protein
LGGSKAIGLVRHSFGRSGQLWAGFRRAKNPLGRYRIHRSFAEEPVLFNVDTGAVKVPRVMERLIAAEAG